MSELARMIDESVIIKNRAMTTANRKRIVNERLLDTYLEFHGQIVRVVQIMEALNLKQTGINLLDTMRRLNIALQDMAEVDIQLGKDIVDMGRADLEFANYVLERYKDE